MEVITGLILPMLIDVATIRKLEPDLKGKEYIGRLEKDSYIRSLRQMAQGTEETEEDDL